MKRLKKLKDDQEWLRRNLKRLIARYGGEYVLIADGKVFPVDESNLKEVEGELKAKYRRPPIGMPVPRKEDLLSVLLICIK